TALSYVFGADSNPSTTSTMPVALSTRITNGSVCFKGVKPTIAIIEREETTTETMASIHADLAILRNSTKRLDSNVLADKSSALSCVLFIIARLLRIFFTATIYFLMRWNFHLMPLVRLIIVIWLRIDMCNRPPRLWQR